jgi:hypothetical protein
VGGRRGPHARGEVLAQSHPSRVRTTGPGLVAATTGYL